MGLRGVGAGLTFSLFVTGACSSGTDGATSGPPQSTAAPTAITTAPGTAATTASTAIAETPATIPTTLPPVEAPEGYELVWRDEFNEAGLNTSLWTIEHSTFGEGNNELHCYTPGNVSVANDVLAITATDNQTTCPGNKVRDYGSGMVHTRDTVAFRYAWFEVRAKVPAGQGLWPAIWLSPNDDAYGLWPRSGEIDLMELRGQNPAVARVNFHYAGSDGSREQSPLDVRANGEGFHETFHTFALRWTDERITWFIDDVEVHSVDDWTSEVGPFPAPFDQRFFLRLNLAVGGNFPGSPDNSTSWPAVMEVDYVRVFQSFP